MNNKNKIDRNYHILYAILWPIFKVLFPVQVIGHENIPEGPVVICPNHTKWNDPFSVVFSFGWKFPMRAMAKIEIIRWPVVGAILEWAGVIGVDRGAADIKAVKSVLKRMFTPSIIAVFVGLIAGLTNISGYVPQFVTTVLEGGAVCMGPVAMILAGIVIGGYDLKEIVKNKKVYLATLMRLIVIPTVFVLGLRLLGADVDVRTLALIAVGTPIGLNTVVYPAAYGGDTKTGASMALISHALSVITIPLMYLLLIELI